MRSTKRCPIPRVSTPHKLLEEPGIATHQTNRQLTFVCLRFGTPSKHCRTQLQSFNVLQLFCMACQPVTTVPLPTQQLPKLRCAHPVQKHMACTALSPFPHRFVVTL